MKIKAASKYRYRYRSIAKGIAEAYAYCEEMAKHYENFTVGSRLLPAEKRKHIYAIYAFCRFVDDLGDKGAGDRLGLLAWWEEELYKCYSSVPEHIIMVALQDTIKKFSIPPEPFLKLIEANRMDQRIKRYSTFQDLLYYCEHSANPVGHIFLYLFGYSDPKRQRLSDYTCTALQLTNFWQDIAEDIKRDRIYIPAEDLKAFNYTEEELQKGKVNENFIELMRFELKRTREFFERGLELVDLVDKELKLDVKLFSLGGMKVLDLIERNGYDVFRRRPTLASWQKGWLFLSTLARIKLK